MRDLSLHLLDLAQNSVRAGASLLEIDLTISGDGWLTLMLRDDGCGMDEALQQAALSPFGTTRTTRKVGLGLPLMAENARRTGGEMTLSSRPGAGTQLTVRLNLRSIDCLPLGDIPGSMVSLITANPQGPDVVLRCESTQGRMSFDTREIRAVLGDVPVNTPEVAQWMLSALREEIEPIVGGAIP